jgi:hypothetical protein
MVDFNDIQPWLFQVKPMPGESLSHFLGRFRRKNGWTPAELTFPVKFGWPTASPQLDHVIEPILSKEPQYQWEFYDDAPDSRLTLPRLQ